MRRQGATWRATHPYLHLINMSWPSFLATVFAAYLAVNTLFAVAYFMVGIDQIHGAEAPTAPARFMNAFSSDRRRYRRWDTARSEFVNRVISPG